MNKKTDSMKLIFLIIGLFGVCYLAYQIYAMSEARLQTETVRTITVTEGINAEGVFFRNEQLITKEGGGVHELMVGEWEKLAKYQDVAVVYSDGDDYEQSLELKELEKKLERLKKTLDSSKEWASPTAINAAIYNSIYQTVDMALSGNLYRLTEAEDGLLSSLLSRESSFSKDSSAEQMLAKLQAEYNALKKVPSGVKKTIRTPYPGLFSSGVDGYEQLFTPQALLSATPEQFSELIGRTPEAVYENSLIGKLVRGNEWYFASLLDETEAKRLSPGGQYDVVFSGGGGGAIPTTLSRLSRGADGKYMAVFSSEYNLQDIVRLRQGECEVILSTYEGFRVPKRAVRIQDGVEGVYCLVGAQAIFKPITRLYELENHYICSADLSSVKELFLYDEIITVGKNLYDGKIVK